MAIINMQKLTLVAHKKDRRKIMKVLAKLGTLEISQSAEYDNTIVNDETKLRDEIESKISSLNFAFAFLKDINRELNTKSLQAQIAEKGTTKPNFGRENLLVDYDDLSDIVSEEYELFDIIERLRNMNSTLVDIKSDKSRLTNLLEQVADYTALDMEFNQFKDSKNTAVMLGTIADDELAMLQDKLPEYSYVHRIPNNGKNIVVVIMLHQVKDEVQKLLHTHEFARCPFSQAQLPTDYYNELSDSISKLDEKRIQIIKQVREYFKFISQFKLLYDYYMLEVAKLNIIKGGRETDKAFVLDGWLPVPQAELTINELKSVAPTMEYMLREPIDGETPPSFVRNNKVVGSFGQVITATFGAPKYGGIEPNVFVAFFYFLFFGFMLSDAGYGILMATFCFSYLIIKKPVKNSGNFMMMFGLCGISTILWGAFFGGWFGMEADALSGNVVGRFLLSLKQLDPLDGQQTLIMFGIALGMGMVQIATGFLLNGISKLKTAPLDGVMNDFGWVVIFVGGGIYALDILLKTSVVGIIGMVIALIGVLMLCVGGALGKKNPIKMVTGALGNLYGSINVFSDILSYARLFGLGLTTGIIGLVVNRIGSIFVDMLPFYLGYIFAVPIWIGGHMFNMAINTLGVYVHNSRLQYVEFFGKFYTGEGKAFKPFGGETKYIYLSDSLSEKSK